MKVADSKNANLPLGRHNAKVVDADKDGIEFELLECDQRGIRLFFKAPKSVTPKSAFGRAIGHLQGYGPIPGEQLELSNYAEFAWRSSRHKSERPQHNHQNANKGLELPKTQQLIRRLIRG